MSSMKSIGQAETEATLKICRTVKDIKWSTRVSGFLYISPPLCPDDSLSPSASVISLIQLLSAASW